MNNEERIAALVAEIESIRVQHQKDIAELSSRIKTLENMLTGGRPLIIESV